MVEFQSGNKHHMPKAFISAMIVIVVIVLLSPTVFAVQCANLVCPPLVAGVNNLTIGVKLGEEGLNVKCSTLCQCPSGYGISKIISSGSLWPGGIGYGPDFFIVCKTKHTNSWLLYRDECDYVASTTLSLGGTWMGEYAQGTYGDYYVSVSQIVCELIPVPTCPVCPAPSDWSMCTNNKQTRTNYKCDATTNYQCQAYTEERPCCPTCPSLSAWSECVAGKQTRTNYRCSAETNYQCQAYTEEQTCTLCGNGKIDAGENCDNCPADAGCQGGLLCYNGKCVTCLQSSDCVGKKVWSREYFCSGNILKERGTELSSQCINHECAGSVDIMRDVEDCGDRLCQDNHCGCSEGYEACQALGECKRIAALEDGTPCKCHFQCKSNYCSNAGTCMKAMDIIFSSQKGVIRVGEATKLTISADNTLDQDIQTKLTINLGTGASMSGVIAGQDCSGNQCTGTVTIPAKGRENIAIDLTGESAGSVELTATVTAEIGGRPYQKSESMTIYVTECGNGKCEQGETQENCCIDCGKCPTKEGVFQKIIDWLKGLLTFLGFKL